MWLKNLRVTSVILGAANVAVLALGGVLVLVAYPTCEHRKVLPIFVVSVVAGFRIFTMVNTGIAQEATAKIILDSPAETNVIDAVIRLQRRIKYKKWLWWTRFTMVVTVVQFVCATYVLFQVAKYISQEGSSNKCVLGLAASSNRWKQKVMMLFMVTVCSVALAQCFTGSDVLRWRSFYATQDDAWKAHYQEVFDHGIREALCCMGRIEYLSVLEEDEVYSVARLLGDLVAYRASGTGHLELLAGLALLQRHSKLPKPCEGFVEAPVEHLQAATALHKYAEAAYTGPLLDIGRNPFLFPCTWLYRQGILTPWTRNRRPVLDGDNWWRGHAAAYLKFTNLSPELLRHGRVCQKKCEAAYFIVVLHHLRSVVVAVRGTETPEDLITDGLGRECPLSAKDLDGLINSSHLHPDIRQRVESSFPHYGHLGVVEAARDLYMQIEGHPEDEPKSGGFLSSLLGAGCECDGYSVHIVGHSLGGAIAAILGIRLYSNFPNLHVYSYGPLPCLDSVIADACSDFVTSIVHDNEFSSRLSVGSVLRLRAAAIKALSEDPNTDTALIFRLARRFLHLSESEKSNAKVEDPAEYTSESSSDEGNHHFYTGGNKQDQNFPLWNETATGQNVAEIDDSDFINPFAADINQMDDSISEFMDIVPVSENGSAGASPEMLLPGLVIHLVPQHRNFNISSWSGWGVQERRQSHKAFIANRESFKDIVVSPSMFLDHLPWRCHQALQRTLEAQNVQGVLDVSQIV